MALAQTLIWACLLYSFPALLLHWEAALGWSRADITAAITIALFVSAFCSPLYGRLIDAGHGGLMMASASVLGGCCLMLLSQVQLIWQFYLLWAVIGVCMAGSLYEPCFALITRARGENAKRAITFVTLVAGFAGTISFPVAHNLAEAFGWRSAVMVFGGIAIFIVSPLMYLAANGIEQDGRKRQLPGTGLLESNHAFLRKPVFWCLAIGFGLAAVLQGVTIYHLLPILDERQVEAEVAVVLISFIGPMQVSGRLAMMLLEPRISNHGIASSCFVLLAIAILFLDFAHGTLGLLVAFVILFGGAYGMVSIIRPVIARDLLGDRHFGAKSGALALVYLAGSASAPYLGSLVWTWGGYDMVLGGLFLVAVGGLGLYSLAHRMRPT